MTEHEDRDLADRVHRKTGPQVLPVWGRFRARGRFYVIRSENNPPWMLIDRIDGTCVDFRTRREAEDEARFCREYVQKWGDIDLATYPWNLDTPLRYEPWEGRDWNRPWLNDDGGLKAG